MAWEVTHEEREEMNGERVGEPNTKRVPLSALHRSPAHCTVPVHPALPFYCPSASSPERPVQRVGQRAPRLFRKLGQKLVLDPLQKGKRDGSPVRFIGHHEVNWVWVGKSGEHSEGGGGG